jgi:hypothetical protein
MLLGSLAAKHGWVGREHVPHLLVFALDGKGRLPPSPAPSKPVPVDDPKFQIDAGARPAWSRGVRGHQQV